MAPGPLPCELTPGSCRVPQTVCAADHADARLEESSDPQTNRAAPVSDVVAFPPEHVAVCAPVTVNVPCGKITVVDFCELNPAGLALVAKQILPLSADVKLQSLFGHEIEFEPRVVVAVHVQRVSALTP